MSSRSTDGVEESTRAHIRALFQRCGGPWEVAAVAAGTLGVWRLALGWNWSAVATSNPLISTAPQSSWDWLVLALAVGVGVGWLARRGHAVAGTFSVAVPIVLLSGWRLADSGIVAWPISLASLIFVLCIVCIMAGGLGAWMRHRATDAGVDNAGFARAPTRPVPVSTARR